MAAPILGSYLGSWNGVQMYAKQFSPNGKMYIGNSVIGNSKETIVPRGKEIVSDTAWIMASGFVVADFAAYSTSGGSGVGIPTDLAVTPLGWARMTDNYGDFFQKADGGTLGVDTNGDGIADADLSPIRSANMIDQITDWVKKNPLLTAGIALALYYVLSQNGKGKKKKFLGIL